MKYKAVLVAFLLVVSLSSCSLFTSSVDGDNIITEQTRIVGSFTGVELDGIGNIFLTQGSQEVRIKTDSNIQDLIKTKIKDGNLVIYQDENISPSQLEIYISNPTYQDIELDGSGTIISQSTLSGDELEVELDGSGDIKLAQVKYDELEVDLDGSGEINIAGETDDLKVDLDGSGDIYMMDCVSNYAKVNLDGSGNITVYAKESFHAELNGSGDIRVGGNPNEVRTTNNGSGDIRKVE